MVIENIPHSTVSLFCQNPQQGFLMHGDMRTENAFKIKPLASIRNPKRCTFSPKYAISSHITLPLALPSSIKAVKSKGFRSLSTECAMLMCFVGEASQGQVQVLRRSVRELAVPKARDKL